MRESGYYWVIPGWLNHFVIGYYQKEYDNWQVMGESQKRYSGSIKYVHEEKIECPQAPNFSRPHHNLTK